MARVLVIGGYGTFGRHVVRLLADDANLAILVAGRDPEQARALIATLSPAARLEAAFFDRDADVGAALSRLAPDVVVDASGPFQHYGDRPWRVAEAAIAQGRDYLDIADDPAFVRGIAALDGAARQRGVVAVSGASTCPALTGAIARRLADGADGEDGMASVDAVVGGIAPSPRFGPGPGILRAVAAMAGRRVAVRRDGGAGHGVPFTETRRMVIAPPGAAPLAPRRFSLADVPDLTLLEDVFPGVRDVWFGVAPTPALYHAALRGLARLVRLGVLRSLTPLAGCFGLVMNRCTYGEHRGGLFLRLDGTEASGAPVSRTFHLVAEGDDGPAIPALAAVLLARRLVHGPRPPAGARPAHRELGFDAFVPLLAAVNVRFGIRTDTGHHVPSPFRAVLGPAFERLPPPVRALHSPGDERRYAGEAEVTAGRSLPARLLRTLFRLPRPGTRVPLEVTIASAGTTETWTRCFAGRRFTSVLSAGRGADEGLLCERFGPLTVAIALVAEDDTLAFVVRRWRLFGLPMPPRLAPRGDIRESADGGRFRFHVEMRVPLVGHLVTYAGWLVVGDVTRAEVPWRPSAVLWERRPRP